MYLKSFVKLKSIIVDDVSSSRAELHSMLQTYCPEVENVHQSSDIEDACRFIASQPVDVVFLDIQMPGGDGFELLEKFTSRSFQVVFVTGYEHYALRAIKINALDYLIKPVRLDEFQSTIRRLVEIKKEERSFQIMQRSLALFQEQVQQKKKAEHITLHHLGGFDIVSINEILYLRAERGYTTFIMNDHRKILVSKTIKVFDEMLREFDFIRIHKTFLVNLYGIQKYKHEDVGWVIMMNGDQLEVSRRRMADFMAAVNSMKIMGS